jgi:hypothetical protein
MAESFSGRAQGAWVVEGIDLSIAWSGCSIDLGADSGALQRRCKPELFHSNPISTLAPTTPIYRFE